jgi:hypothetical protein
MTLHRKFTALAIVFLMVSLSFADTNNSTLLNAYTRHTVQASQDIAKMVTDKAGTVAEQQVLSDHFIRLGRHVGLLNANVAAVESAILANPNAFVNGDWSREIATVQAKLNALGFKGKVPNPNAISRAKTLANIKQYGLKGYLGVIGAALEQQGGTLVSPYSYYTSPLSHARLLPSRMPVCDEWAQVAGDMGAMAGIALLVGQPELSAMFGGSAGFIWFYAFYIC